MNSFNRCPKCDNYHWDNEKCNPEYTVYHDDYLGKDGKKMRAIDPVDAALRYASYYNERSDYCLMNEEIEIEVQDHDGQRIKYKIGAEASIDYHANRV
ncbi:MAG: hypothetical protein ACKV1O_30895 [Saprospiraceae bacterium]